MVTRKNVLNITIYRHSKKINTHMHAQHKGAQIELRCGDLKGRHVSFTVDCSSTMYNP